MPWLEPDESGYFHVALRYQGRRYRRSLKTSDRRKAEIVLARIEDNLGLVARGRMVIPDDADIASFLMSDGRVVGPSVKTVSVETLTQLFTTYFERMGDNKLEPSTIDGMKIHRRHLERHLGKRLCLATTTADALQQYIDDRSLDKVRNKRVISPATVKKELVSLRTAWNFLSHLGLVSKPYPGKRLVYPKTDSKLPFRTLAEIEQRLSRGNVTADYASQLWESVFLSVDELAEFLKHVKDHAQEPYAYLLFVFAGHTGARRSELLRSEIDDFDFHSGTVHIHERKRVKGERSTRSVPMSSTLEAAARQWLQLHPGGKYTFPELVDISAGKKSDLPQVRLDLQRAHRIFGRTVAGSRWENLSGYHLLRHSFVSNCAASGIDQRVISAFVGHLSPETERRYRHLLPRQARDSIQSVFG